MKSSKKPQTKQEKRQEQRRLNQQRAVAKQKAKAEELYTISGMRRMLTKMQVAGLTFAAVGLLMPRYFPFYAEKEWHTLFGVTLGLPQALIAAGCVMIIVSIVCFLRSYRCAKCGGLLGLTHFRQPTTCRSCGKKVSDQDIKVEKVQF